METLTELLQESARKFAQKPFMRMRPRWRKMVWTYRDFDRRARGAAVLLERHGVRQGDRVILIAPNSPYWGAAFFGIMYRGAVAVPLNPSSTCEFVEKIVDATDATIILSSSLVRLQTTRAKIVTIEELEPSNELHCYQHVVPNSLAEIVYTSGTTGDPKGVMLTHGNIIANVKGIASVFRPAKNDRILSLLPLFHMYEQTVSLFMSMLHGIEIMYTPALSSRAIRETLQEHRSTKMLVVPEVLESMLRRIESTARSAGREDSFKKTLIFASYLPHFFRRFLFRRVHKNLGGALRIIACGGAALPVEVENAWNSMGFHVLQGYGLTETAPAVSSNTLSDHRVGSIGKVIPSVCVNIAPDGEILVSGPSVFSGYYNNSEQTQIVFDEQGRFKTGDLGYFDGDGFLFINGRKKYVIVTSSGENVYPEDIESVLKGIEGVSDAAVLGIKANGRTIVHACLLGDNLDGSDVVCQANDELARHQKILDWSVWPRADFPRSATRKVKKEEVRAFIESQAQQGGALSSVSPATPIMRVIASVCGKGLNELSETSVLVSDLHFDSLMRIELVSRLEEEFDTTVEERDITEKTTVADVERLVFEERHEEKPRQHKPWLLSLPVCIVREFLIRALILPLYSIMVRIRVHGRENFDRVTPPMFLMPNHLSYIDTIVVFRALPSHVRRRVAIAAAFDVLYEGYWMVAALLEFIFNSYPLPRKEHESIKPGLQSTGKILDAGYSVLVFPEGTISREGKLQSLKRGSGLMATEMHVPVVPIIIDRVSHIVPPYSVIPRRFGVVNVHIGKPLYFNKPGESYLDATKRIESAMLELQSKL